jgi:hypothetical protein
LTVLDLEAFGTGAGIGVCEAKAVSAPAGEDCPSP